MIYPPPAHDPTTLDFYEREATTYVASGQQVASRWLDGFMRRLPAGARVLDLGCGGGRDAVALIAAGFEVEPTDGSPAMAATAAARLGRPVAVMRFDALAEVAAFDAVWANASLLHVPRAALGDILVRIFRALKPGGLHFASYKAGGTAGRDGLGRYFNYPGKEALTAAYLGAAPWEIVALEQGIGGGYEGAETPWIAITLRKPLA